MKDVAEIHVLILATGVRGHMLPKRRWGWSWGSEGTDGNAHSFGKMAFPLCVVLQ